MPLNNARSGYNSVAEYQMSGLPWVLSSSLAAGAATAIDFPYGTRAINIINNSSAGNFLRIGFTSNGVSNANCYLLNGGQQVRPEVRVRTLWLSASSAVSYCILAELTTIESLHIMPLSGTVTGSNLGWTGV